MADANWIGRFVPTKTFMAKVNGSRNKYLQGQFYHVREGSIYNDLRKCLVEWERQGLVTVFKGVTPQATGEASVRMK